MPLSPVTHRFKRQPSSQTTDDGALVSRQRAVVSLRVRAMQYLARREYSRAELRARLLPYLAEGDDLEGLLDDLAARDWLNEARAAEHWVHSKQSRFGTQRVAHELRQRGISDGLISEVLPALRETELARAVAVWQRKFAALPLDAKEKARRIRFLQSRGFALEVVLKVVGGAALREDEQYEP